MLDDFIQEERKLGAIIMKYAQAGISDIHVCLAGYLFDHMPGPTMFLCSRKDQARKFGIERFGPMIAQSKALRGTFRLGKQNHETLTYKESSSGPLILAGAGSANEFISNPFRWIFVDEYDDIGEIPSHGDPWAVLRKRQGEYETRVRCGAFGWAHPTLPDRGIAKLYADLSDQREWVIDCPHCGEAVIMDWEHVRIDDQDADTARYECPHCTEVITDSQRWRATREGRFVSQLEPSESARRRFIGYHVSKLCHPRVELRNIAADFLDCRTESQLKVFHNKVMGRPYLPVSVVLTEPMVRSKEHGQHRMKQCPRDTWKITAGVDVQKPQTNPTLYYTIVAWTRSANAVLLDYGRVRGWTVLDQVLRNAHFRASGAQDELRISACAIDHGYETQQVYEFCRQHHGGVPCVPYKHTPGVKEDQPTRLKTTTNPLAPELGAMRRLETCRLYWMDRVLGRFSPTQDSTVGGSIVLPPNVDAEFVNHILAPKRFEREDEHGHLKADYVKEEGRRDDWLQCLVGAEIMAVARGLDKLHRVQAAKPRHHGVTSGLREEHTGFGRRRTGRYRRRRRGRTC